MNAGIRENGELAKQILMNTIRVFRSEIHSFGCSRLICIWMKLHHICTDFVPFTTVAASVDLIQECQ